MVIKPFFGTNRNPRTLKTFVLEPKEKRDKMVDIRLVQKIDFFSRSFNFD